MDRPGTPRGQRPNYQIWLDRQLEAFEREGRTPKLLLHSCCAPCSSYVLEYLTRYFEVSLSYYNPNIQPREEYELRLENQLKVLSCIRDLRQRGVGCLINTHYPAHALEISDQALVMLPGQRFVFGKTEEVLTAETLTEAFGVEVTIFKTQLADGRIVSNVTAVSA